MPQTVTVTAIEDTVDEGIHNATVTHSVSSNNVDFNGGGSMSTGTPFTPGVNVTATITDNDEAGVRLSTSSVAVAEGGMNGSYTVVLSSKPISSVTVAVTSSGQAITYPSSVTFTSSNWQAQQVVTVVAVNDALSENAYGGVHSGGLLTHHATSSDSNYNTTATVCKDMIERQCDASMQFCLNVSMQQCYSGVSFMPSSNVAVTASDNDAGVTLSKITLEVSEGGRVDSYQLVLNTPPTADVTVSAVGNADVMTTPGAVVFTASNWNVTQTVAVSAIDDSYFESSENHAITHTVTSGDVRYSATELAFWYGSQQSSASVMVSVYDNDAASVTISKSAVVVTEGVSTDAYTVVLTSKPTSRNGQTELPTSSVTVAVTANSQVRVQPTTLVFSAANWNMTQQVTVSAINDLVDELTEEHTLWHSASSSDVDYHGSNALFVGGSNITATVHDNDFAGVTLKKQSVVGVTDSLTIREGGANSSYSLVLDSEPTHNVQLSVSIPTGSTNQFVASPAVLEFTSTNWNQAQTVLVSAVEDSLDEPVQVFSITHTSVSVDPFYSSNAVSYWPSSAMRVMVYDNGGVSLSPALGVRRRAACRTRTVLC